MSNTIRCPKCGNTERFRVAALTTATVVTQGESYDVDKTEATFWDDDAETSCVRCGFTSEWQKFTVDERTFNRCVNCGLTIFWDAGDVGWNSDSEGGLICDHGDELTSTPPGGHMPAWLTLAEFRYLTKDLPDSAPLTVYVNDTWQNLRLTKEDVDYFLDESNMSVVLTATDDFDTRQW